jgi:hypothetical protein
VSETASMTDTTAWRGGEVIGQGCACVWAPDHVHLPTTIVARWSVYGPSAGTTAGRRIAPPLKG